MTLLASLLGAAALAGGGDASFIDASVRVDGKVLDWRFLDVEGDGPIELAISLRTPSGSRELQLFRCSERAIEPEPFRKVPILKDIVAWTFADVRDDLDGRELVLLTRQGAWSFDPRRTSYKGNIERLAEVAEVLHQSHLRPDLLSYQTGTGLLLALRLENFAQRDQLVVGGVDQSRALVEVGLVPVPVVGVEAPEAATSGARDGADVVPAADADAGATHPEVHVDEHADVRGELGHLVHGLRQGRE